MLEYSLYFGDDCSVCKKYECEYDINDMMDEFTKCNLFGDAAEKSNAAEKDPMENCTYEITIDYENSPQKVIEGTFDKSFLPNDYAVFAERTVMPRTDRLLMLNIFPQRMPRSRLMKLSI